MEVWRAAQEGLRTVIVNPGVILGPGFWNTGSGRFFGAAAKEHRYCPPGGTGFVCVNTVVGTMRNLMASDILGERFILVDTHWSYKELFHKITGNMGKKAPERPLKKWQLQLGVFWDLARGLLFNKERTLTQSMVHGLLNERELRTDKIKTTGMFAQDNIQQVLKMTTEKYLQEH